MSRLSIRMLSVPLAAAAALVAFQPVAASTPVSATGTFYFVAPPAPSNFRTADGNSFVTLSFPAGVLTGPGATTTAAIPSGRSSCRSASV